MAFGSKLLYIVRLVLPSFTTPLSCLFDGFFFFFTKAGMYDHGQLHMKHGAFFLLVHIGFGHT